MENKNILQIYQNLNFPIISASLKEIVTENKKLKKEFRPFFKGWQNEENYNVDNINENYNCFFLGLGKQLTDGKYLFGFDVDDKNEDKRQNGLVKWKEIVKEKNFHPDTPTATTGNGGLHYLFKLSKEQFERVKTSITDLKIDDVEYTIDTKCNKSCFIVEPTTYKDIKGNTKKYIWTIRPTTVDKIADLPDWLEELFIKHYNKDADIKDIKKAERGEKIDIKFDYPKLPITEDDLKLINIIPLEHFNDLKKWRKMIWIFKNVGLPFEEFVRLSASSPKFQGSKDCFNWWQCCRNTANINIGLLHSIVKTENPDKYFEMNLQYINQEDEIFETTKMECRYLLKEGCVFNYKDDVFTDSIYDFFKDDFVKSFNLKSPYDTGKTQLLSKIIKRFSQYKKILWLSYRKTLTSDILGSFGNQYNFVDYQTGNYKADRLIIQLESILKVEGKEIFGGCELPSYDLVIIDEVESILSQFNSPTFKGNSKTCFEYIEGILENSKKIITLDGDLGQKTYQFINAFGASVRIENTIKFNPKNYIITDDRNEYSQQILKDIKDKKKIVIVSMSASECEYFKDLIEKFTEKEKPEDKPNILLYTGQSDDKKKSELKDVKKKWAEADVLLYSPTIEAGVNFDLEHFDKIYGLICSKSTTPRAFLQMLARIRKVKSTDILILNEHFKYNNLAMNQFYTFNEVKNFVLNLEDIQVSSEIKKIDGKMCKISKLKAYDVNYIYNRLEVLNSGKYYFLATLKMLMINKGSTVVIKTQDKKPKKVEKETFADKILKIEDIDDTEYTTLTTKQKKSEATEEDKFKIAKHSYKMKLGVDKLNDEILSAFREKSRVDNFVYLIDDKNIPLHLDNQTKEKKLKIKILNSIIKDLGFKNIFDTTPILKEDFIKNSETLMANNEFFTNFSNTKTLFNVNKNKRDLTQKGFLGFINTILDDYCINIKYHQLPKSQNRATSYIIIQKDNINEILQYKIRKGFILNDTNKIRTAPTTTVYKDLVIWEIKAEDTK